MSHDKINSIRDTVCIHLWKGRQKERGFRKQCDAQQGLDHDAESIKVNDLEDTKCTD